ncbi:MAG: hypothetical protein COU10_03180 [Candidatus Harrisonbacteria bacterium CG10_big_fil_rev_8_21_14_0_10_45_28]|uniref:Uncharacterized protein n=1 Tax=Candidatus Harrisonbacteria bacterium CG10_big_fil_rev_8_21_14_0_10_45_28 TaxID=1974586 RepID=A0A2H0UPV8_9BACT|nr:MAG: hypothetical protein COU10_03180 [Candidatus Harrisonbacteria bacterium CG10_big_fil_rev_8_21_14_0_10_45_28]
MKNSFIKANSRRRRGAAALPVILLLGGIVVEIGVAGAVLLFYLNNSLYGSKLASEALALAQSGSNEAVRQVILNKGTLGPIGMSVGNGSFAVTISRDCVANSCTVTATSLGRVLNREHTIVTTMLVNDDTGEVDIQSIEESE